MIFTVGVGTAEGSFIPTFVGGRADYKRDQSGNPIRSSLNEEMLQSLAEEGEGAYFNLASGSDRVIEALRTGIDSVEKREMEQRIFNEYESYFQYFIAVAIFLLLLEFIISYRRNKYLQNRDLFRI